MHRRFLETQQSMAPSNQNGKFLEDAASFEKNLVIVLGALLCALIVAIVSNTISKCFTRCRESFSQETTITRRLTGRGLKKRDLNKIPVTVYGSGENIPTTECPICLGEFENGDRVRMLPKCNHGFHVKCIDTWLVSHSSCPICRHSIFEQEQQVAGDGSPENEAGRRNDVAVVVEQAS